MSKALEFVWPGLGPFFLALLIFGFLPGAVVRVIAGLAFTRDDPRRAEMIAEVYEVPRWARPMWVFQQLEVALFEGVGPRLKRFAIRAWKGRGASRSWAVLNRWANDPSPRFALIMTGVGLVLGGSQILLTVYAPSVAPFGVTFWTVITAGFGVGGALMLWASIRNRRAQSAASRQGR